MGSCNGSSDQQESVGHTHWYIDVTETIERRLTGKTGQRPSRD